MFNLVYILLGVLMFFSPCVLPIYPLYISYITGINVTDLKTDKSMQKFFVTLHSILFVMGFTSVLFLAGISMTIVGSFILKYTQLLRVIGGIVVIVMGLFLLGIIKSEKMSRSTEKKRRHKDVTVWNSYMVGLSIGLGWTPCIGPALASIYLLNVTDPFVAMSNLLLFSVGFAIPFVLLSSFISKLSVFNKHTGKAQKVMGVIFIIMGFLMMTGLIGDLSSELTRLFGGTWGFMENMVNDIERLLQQYIGN